MTASAAPAGPRARHPIRSLLRDHRGVSATEFALVAPVFLVMLMGGLELGYTSYVKATLEGELQRVGRSRTMETASSDQQRALLEAQVSDTVRLLAPTARVSFTRKVFRDYTGATTGMEPFKDANGNGRCDAKEVYEDVNNNDKWDKAGVADSDGGARDVVVFTATVDYDSLPTAGILSWARSNTIQAQTALRNQPFDQQAPLPERTCK
jgi:Flp pilus assembly protein TadG